MKNSIGTLTIKVKVKLSLWSAIKLRIAGIKFNELDKISLEQKKDFNPFEKMKEKGISQYFNGLDADKYVEALRS